MSTRSRQRTAITGLGMVTCLGSDLATCWEGLVAGRTGIGPITEFDPTGCISTFGGQLPPDYASVEQVFFSKRQAKQTVPTARLGFVCAQQAIEDAGFSMEGRDPWRCAVISGSGMTGDPAMTETGAAEVDRFTIIRQMSNAIAGWISIKHGMKGPTYNIATACASGGYAISAGHDFITSGRGDAAVVLGVDMMLTRGSVSGFNALQALSERNGDPARASRPFDRDRDGFVMANGGCALVLENLEAARARGARIYATVSGTGLCSEAYNIVAPDPSGEGMARCMQLALEDGAMDAEQIDYISAHGTSTHHNDAGETAAVKRVFGAHARRLAISSQKSMTGHTIGGAGAIEAAATALSLYHGVLTPTINYETPDPECDLDYVPNTARETDSLRAALSNSFGFGGHNCSILLEKLS